MTRKLYTLYISDNGKFSGFRYRGLFPKTELSIPLGQSELFIVEEAELHDYLKTVDDNDSPTSYFLFEVGGTNERPNGRLSLVWLGQFEEHIQASNACSDKFRFNSHYFARVLNVPQARRLFHKSENLFVQPEHQSRLIH